MPSHLYTTILSCTTAHNYFSIVDTTTCEQRYLPQFLLKLPQLTKDETLNGHSGDLTLENYAEVHMYVYMQNGHACVILGQFRS